MGELDDEPADLDASEAGRSWKKPLAVIGALFILFIFILSLIPLQAIRASPPPDLEMVDVFELSSGEKSDLEAVNYIATGSIDSAIKQVDVFDYRVLTNRLVSSACSAHSNSCYTKAVYYYVRDLRYVSDPVSRQYVQSPAETLLSGAGDCEDKALASAVMLESIGIDADVGVTNDHAFVRVHSSDAPFWKRADEYIWLDPITNQAYGELSFLNKNVVGWYEVA